MNIRKALPEEAGALTDLALRSKASWGYDDAFMNAIRDDMIVTREYLEREYALVAEHDGNVVGYAIMRVDESGGYLRDLFIDPPFMGSGIGAMLFDEMIAFARSAGAKRITLVSDPYAVGFYQRYGMRETGREPSTFVPGRALPILEMEL